MTAAAGDVPAGWPPEVHPESTLRITAVTAKQRSRSDRISLLQTPATRRYSIGRSRSAAAWNGGAATL